MVLYAAWILQLMHQSIQQRRLAHFPVRFRHEDDVPQGDAFYPGPYWLQSKQNPRVNKAYFIDVILMSKDNLYDIYESVLYKEWFWRGKKKFQKFFWEKIFFWEKRHGPRKIHKNFRGLKFF